jgi:hypothetical protein
MKVIPGQGMPSHRHHEPGSLFVKLNIKFPDFIDPTVIPHLEAALPARDPPNTYPKEVHVEEVDMADLDARQQEQAQRSQDAMDEDDEEQPRVQCKFHYWRYHTQLIYFLFRRQPIDVLLFYLLFSTLHARVSHSFILFFVPCPSVS